MMPSTSSKHYPPGLSPASSVGECTQGVTQGMGGISDGYVWLLIDSSGNIRHKQLASFSRVMKVPPLAWAGLTP
eukprot:1191916-Prorocentrum_minimum.AAC.6